MAWLGLMEGAADATAQALKLVTGRASDRSGRRAAWVAAGYSTNALVRPLAGVGLLLGMPAWIVMCRIGDRIGKGLRGSASDALIADWVTEGDRARAYAHMRTLDHLGATAGALAAAAAVGLWQGIEIGWLVLAMALPAVIMLWWCRGLHDVERDAATAAAASLHAGWWPADSQTRQILLIMAVAGIGARLGPLIILAHVAGVGDAENAWPLWIMCLAWGALALVQAGAAAFAGWATERLGALVFLRYGWLVGALVFIGLALTAGSWLIASGLSWGLLSGFTEGAEKTAVAGSVPKGERATAFGALGLLSAGAGFLGSGLVGLGLAYLGGIIFLLPAASLALGALLLKPRNFR